MSLVGPYDHYAGILERKNGLIDLVIRNRPGVIAYRIWISPTIDDAYGNPGSSAVGGNELDRKMLFQVKQGTLYRSRTLRRQNYGVNGENNRGVTRVLFSLNDVWAQSDAPSGTVTVASVQAGDTVTIEGVVFTAAGAGANPAAQEFDETAGTDALVAASLVATINDAASQALITAASGGPGVTAANGGTAVVTLTADEVSTDAELTLVSSTGARLAVSAATLLLSRAVPPEGSVCFIRLQEVRATSGALETSNGDPLMGPILPVPPPEFYGLMTPMLSLSATAPADTGAAVDVTPASVLDHDQDANSAPMSIVFPLPTTMLNLRNRDGARSLLYSFGWGMPFNALPANTQTEIQVGSVKELIIAGDGGAVDFGVDVTFQMVAL